MAGKHLATNRNKGRVLNISTAFVGNSVFWKPNYFAEENEVQFETKNGKQVKVKEKYDFKYYFK